MLQHRGYTGSVELDGPRLCGEVQGIADVVTYEAATASGLRKAFCESVDDYLAWCAERREPPNQPGRVSRAKQAICAEHGLPASRKFAQVLNYAIRQELLAGDAVLSAMPLLHRAARKLGQVADKDPGSPEARQARLIQQAHDLLSECRDLLAEEVIARYSGERPLEEDDSPGAD